LDDHIEQGLFLTILTVIKWEWRQLWGF